MADVSPIYKLYAHTLWAEKNMFGAWPPIMTDIVLGSYGELTSNGFQVLGNITDLVGTTLGDVTPPSPQACFSVSSKSMSTEYFQQTGSALVPVEDLDAVGEGQAQIKYTCDSTTNFQVTVDDVARTDISASVEDYLRDAIWPLIKGQTKGTWNSDWRLICSIFTSDSYVFVGGTQKDTQFALNATGDVLSDYGNGQITAAIGMQAMNKVGDAVSSYKGQTGVIGMSLWHFDGHGNPQLDKG